MTTTKSVMKGLVVVPRLLTGLYQDGMFRGSSERHWSTQQLYHKTSKKGAGLAAKASYDGITSVNVKVWLASGPHIP